ncbi:MAG: hypothetical protein Q4G71_16795 [Pseudomonadota bacterium]|nr:hypothetical protein [Pseudomonadota bacterium]
MSAPDSTDAPQAAAPCAFPAASTAAAPVPEAGWLYAGAVGGRLLSLWLPPEPAAGAGAGTGGAAQVLRLARAEPLIAAVEQWLRAAWDPAPVVTQAAPAVCHAVVRDPALAPPGTRLCLPPGALLTAPPDALRAPGLAWESVTAEVQLDTAAPEAVAALMPGDVLWLPASLGRWAVRLRDVTGQWPDCPARLDLHAQRLSVSQGADTPPPAQAGSEVAGEVLLAARVRVPLDHWLGFARAGLAFHWPVPQPWAAELRAAGTARVLAQGALLPLGQGCGLRVDGPAEGGAPAGPPPSEQPPPARHGGEDEDAYVLS